MDNTPNPNQLSETPNTPTELPDRPGINTELSAPAEQPEDDKEARIAELKASVQRQAEAHAANSSGAAPEQHPLVEDAESRSTEDYEGMSKEEKLASVREQVQQAMQLPVTPTPEGPKNNLAQIEGDNLDLAAIDKAQVEAAPYQPPASPEASGV